MLSYQHSYHAGGPADAHKHVALALLARHLAAKAKPACVIDLYAGGGTYRLDTPEAQKTSEFRQGIGLLWERRAAPGALAPYLDTVRALNSGPDLSVYPGSPEILRQLLRENDALILNELHPGALHDLRRWAGSTGLAGAGPSIAVHQRDGLEALAGLVPPAIRRGLVLIDPSYEMKTDYAAIPQQLAAAVRKWREGIYMVWYPVLDQRHRPLLDGIAAIDAPSIAAELTLPHRTTGLRGTGVIVVNPPWRFNEEIRDAGVALGKILGSKHAVRWLRREAP